MKVKALSPQFVIEAPPGEEGQEQKRVARELKPLSVVSTSKSSSDSTGGKTHSSHKQDQQENDGSEITSGLTRLAEFIKKQRRNLEEQQKQAADANAEREQRADMDSHQFTSLIVAWSQKNQGKNHSVAQVLRDELKRREALLIYKKAAKSRSSLLPGEKAHETNLFF